MALSPELAALVKQTKNKMNRTGARSKKLKAGKTQVRVLPNPSAKDGKFWAELGVHWIKTEENGKPVAVVGCDDHVHGKSCAICTAIDRASKAAVDDSTLKIVKEWKVKKSVLVNALIRSGDDKSDDPVILELTETTFAQILGMIGEYEDDYGDILDPKTGIDFMIERIGSGLDTKYSVLPKMKAAPVPDGVMSRLNDLDAHIETEFFRGDERKALTAIANMMGIRVNDLMIGSSGGSAATTASSALLTAPAAKDTIDLSAARKKAETEVEDADVLDSVTDVEIEELDTDEVKPVEKAEVKKTEAKVENKALPQSDVDDMLAELDDLK
jgi:hypothetical protein